MKKLLFSLSVLLLTACVPVEPMQTPLVSIPEPTGLVNDFADVLSPETEDKLEATLKTFPNEVAILTVKDMGGMSIEEYGIKVAEKWKVGDKDKDDGIIFITSIGDRKTRFEVGYGAEGDLNDSKAGKIMDDFIIPHFKNNDWEKGIVGGVDGLKKVFK